ncbi:MAG: serine acetyltransferase [Acidimicrobiales bacterium]|nr:serine acetyltransferase [Acidimicrobiales bacterium]
MSKATSGATASNGSSGDAAEDPGVRLHRERAAQNPRFAVAVLADAKTAVAYRGEGPVTATGRIAWLRVILGLMWRADSFFALVCYRLRSDLRTRGVPVLPRLLHHVSVATAQISIGDPVIVHPGIYIPHGQVVVDGLTEVHSGAILYPFVNLGLLGPDITGPTIGAGAMIGTGAKVLGPTNVGKGARIGANAVVVHDVPDGATAVGVPAAVVG